MSSDPYHITLLLSLIADLNKLAENAPLMTYFINHLPNTFLTTVAPMGTRIQETDVERACQDAIWSLCRKATPQCQTNGEYDCDKFIQYENAAERTIAGISTWFNGE